MDRDKDGIIGRGDIRATADEVGVSLSDQQIDQMVSDCPAAINFTQLINMFGMRQQVRIHTTRQHTTRQHTTRQNTDILQPKRASEQSRVVS